MPPWQEVRPKGLGQSRPPTPLLTAIIFWVHNVKLSQAYTTLALSVILLLYEVFAVLIPVISQNSQNNNFNIRKKKYTAYKEHMKVIIASMTNQSSKGNN